MIPFAALTLGPALAVFGQPVIVTPASSQPGAAAYPARGVYRLAPIEVQIEETGLFHRTHRPELGIRLSGFAIAPQQGDTIARAAGTVFAEGLLPDGVFSVEDIVLDGQGGANLILQKVA